jgi:hypothetical protein
VVFPSEYRYYDMKYSPTAEAKEKPMVSLAVSYEEVGCLESGSKVLTVLNSRIIGKLSRCFEDPLT